MPALDPVGIDLLSRMLAYAPSQRITAYEALQHEYFMEYFPERPPVPQPQSQLSMLQVRMQRLLLAASMSQGRN